jgi:acyl-CoA synthetase (AMP-forming)/AMP-acid ligase II/acyl carrier protein
MIGYKGVKGDLFQWLTERAQAQPEAPALMAPGRRTLSYSGLTGFVSHIAGALSAGGYGCQDRLAIVLPAGPEAATAFLAVSAFATAAPLNPSLRQEDFEFYLSDLGIQGLVTHDASHPSAHAARRLGIRVHLARPLTEDGAGVFELDSLRPSSDRFTIRREPRETALLLHTSGTTARPKIVPLTHANLLASARNVAASLQLAPADRCLNIMPLFHIHGLVASLLASLYAGGSVVCAPVFQAPLFFDWMREFSPTWYTAVPTMHQSILARASKEQSGRLDRRLRFLRSCSAPLAPALLTQLEDCFEAPVIEAYGMTEAAHQIASNPLPPRAHKPGTVGLPTGPEAAIMDEEGRLLEPGIEGEIVIRGENVTPGYLDNPAANEQAFRDGWFRTGDLGAFDEDGYLRITGRLKEMINRGGEKIAPREVDEALLHHPAVAQAVAFAIPDSRLGEDVGAAVVLKDGMQVSAAELRRFAADHLADFKVPSEIVFVSDIPKGPTGKLQRIGLAERLGIRGRQQRDGDAGRPPSEPPATEIEKLLAALWSEVLRIDAIGVTEDFLSLGGDSLLAAQLAARIRSRLNVELRIVDLLDASTVRAQAQRIERARTQGAAGRDKAASRPAP